MQFNPDEIAETQMTLTARWHGRDLAVPNEVRTFVVYDQIEMDNDATLNP